MREEAACPTPPAGHSLLMAKLAERAEACSPHPAQPLTQAGKVSLTMSVPDSA